MADSKNPQNPKHLKGFWPVFIVVVIALILGGIIYNFAYGNILLDENNASMSFWSYLTPHRSAQKVPAKTLPAKQPAATK